MADERKAAMVAAVMRIEVAARRLAKECHVMAQHEIQDKAKQEGEDRLAEVVEGCMELMRLAGYEDAARPDDTDEGEPTRLVAAMQACLRAMAENDLGGSVLLVAPSHCAVETVCPSWADVELVEDGNGRQGGIAHYDYKQPKRCEDTLRFIKVVRDEVTAIARRFAKLFDVSSDQLQRSGAIMAVPKSKPPSEVN